MKRSTFAIIAAVVLVIIVVAVVMANKKDNVTSSSTTSTSQSTTESKNNPNSSQSSNQNQTTNSVTIENMAFSPTKITVKKGTTVTWTNKDDTAHTVTPDSATSDFKASDTLNKGQTYSVTFNSVGSYAYHCAFHSSMTGTVTVTD